MAAYGATRSIEAELPRHKPIRPEEHKITRKWEVEDKTRRANLFACECFAPFSSLACRWTAYWSIGGWSWLGPPEPLSTWPPCPPSSQQSTSWECAHDLHVASCWARNEQFTSSFPRIINVPTKGTVSLDHTQLTHNSGSTIIITLFKSTFFVTNICSRFLIWFLKYSTASYLQSYLCLLILKISQKII